VFPRFPSLFFFLPYAPPDLFFSAAAGLSTNLFTLLKEEGFLGQQPADEADHFPPWTPSNPARLFTVYVHPPSWSVPLPAQPQRPHRCPLFLRLEPIRPHPGLREIFTDRPSADSTETIKRTPHDKTFFCDSFPPSHTPIKFYHPYRWVYTFSPLIPTLMR